MQVLPPVQKEKLNLTFDALLRNMVGQVLMLLCYYRIRVMEIGVIML